jgi:hypothetical protein
MGRLFNPRNLAVATIKAATPKNRSTMLRWNISAMIRRRPRATQKNVGVSVMIVPLDEGPIYTRIDFKGERKLRGVPYSDCIRNLGLLIEVLPQKPLQDKG